MSSGEEGCVSSLEVEIDGPGESLDVYEGSLLLLKDSSATGGADLSVT
jgi:hypothetical protein